ncbi:MAG: tetratricopeptide repeat protein [Planctomycetes bacterium]|nr:tetratricopeptide repeat protein [Planctomycetota bacterium]
MRKIKSPAPAEATPAAAPLTEGADGRDTTDLSALRAAVRAAPEDPAAWHALGRALAAAGRWREAETPLAEAVEAAPGDALYRSDLGLALYRQRRYDEAAPHLDRALANDPRLEDPRSCLGIKAVTQLALCHAQSGRHARAAETLAPALPLAIEILAHLGRFHLSAGDHLAARRILVPAAALAPLAEDIVHGAGLALLLLGEWEEAEAHLERATHLAPPCVEAWYDRGLNLTRTRRVDLRPAARAHFEKALAMNPRHAWAEHGLACLAARDGDADEAFRRLARARAAGLSDRAAFEEEPDLAPLRSEPRWKSIEAVR